MTANNPGARESGCERRWFQWLASGSLVALVEGYGLLGSILVGNDVDVRAIESRVCKRG